MVKIYFKTSSKAQTFQIDVDLTHTKTIAELKQLVANYNHQSVSCIRLINKGRILKDDTILEQLRLSEGEIVHAVIKTTQKTEQTANEHTYRSDTTSPQHSQQVGLGGFEGMGGIDQIEIDLDALTKLSDKIMDVMMTPDMMGLMISVNPMLKNMVDANPQVKAMLSDPLRLRQILEIKKNESAITIMSQMSIMERIAQAQQNLVHVQRQSVQVQQLEMQFYQQVGLLQQQIAQVVQRQNQRQSQPQMLSAYQQGMKGEQEQEDYKIVYRAQLEELRVTGFPNQAVNLQVLKQTGGNVEAAVEKLLGI